MIRRKEYCRHKRNTRKWYEKILSLIYPDACPICGRLSEEGICQMCQKKIIYIKEPRCMKCGKPISNEDQEYCYDCERLDHIYDRGYALWVHESGIKKSIYQFKFHNKRIYRHFFANELYKSYGNTISRWNISVIIPIPLNKKKKKYRGYNQAELIADELGKHMDLPVEKEKLIRVKHTKPQKALNDRERRANIKGAFYWKGRSLTGQNILLIDDIYTTGNTVDEAARILKKAGACKVYFLTISIGQGT